MTRFGLMIAFVSVCVTTSMPVAAGNVYKTVDAQGNVVYSDRRENPGTEKLNIKSADTDLVRVEIEAKRSKERRAKRDLENKESEAKQAFEAEQTTRNDQRCVEARQRFEKLNTSRRLREETADGEYRYYSAEEQTEAIEKARAGMAELCGTG